MKKILLFLLLATPAFAEVPPPGTSRKGPIVVTPEGMGTFEYDLKDYAVVKRGVEPTIQQRLDGLRRKVKELSQDNNRLRNQPMARTIPAPIQRTSERVVERVVTSEDRSKHALGVYIGVMPDGVHIDNKATSRKAEFHETGSAIGASYEYRFTPTWGVEAFGAVTTRSTYIPAGFIGPKFHF